MEKVMQRDLRERIERRRIIWVEFLNKDMKIRMGKSNAGRTKGKDQKAANNMGMGGVFK